YRGSGDEQVLPGKTVNRQSILRGAWRKLQTFSPLIKTEKSGPSQKMLGRAEKERSAEALHPHVKDERLADGGVRAPISSFSRPLECWVHLEIATGVRPSRAQECLTGWGIGL